LNKVEGLTVRIEKKLTEYVKVFIRNDTQKIFRILSDAFVEFIFKDFFEVVVSINNKLIIFLRLVLKIHFDRGVSLGNILDILVRKSNCRFN
jgi:hypothetical protein